MSRFTGPLAIREVDVDKEIWELLEELVWEVGHLGSGKEIIVPAGFCSDGASIPWPLSIILHRWGRYRRPACLHDFLCRMIRDGMPHPFAPSRKASDRIFAAANKASGVWPVTRAILYAGVRFGAWTGIGTPRSA